MSSPHPPFQHKNHHKSLVCCPTKCHHSGCISITYNNDPIFELKNIPKKIKIKIFEPHNFKIEELSMHDDILYIVLNNVCIYACNVKLAINPI